MAGLLDDLLAGPVPRDPQYHYGGILPFRKPKAGGPAEWHPLYSDTVAGLLNMFTAPRRAYEGTAGPGDALEMGLGLLGVGGALGPVVSRAGGMGTLPANVWHGSPHRFAPTQRNPLGEFDPTKIGTGEGAQAKGMGHYTADLPSTANSYRDTKKGNLYNVDLPDEAIAQMLDYDAPLSGQAESVRAALQGIDNRTVQQALARDWSGHKLISELEAALATQQQVPGMPAGVTQPVGGPAATSEMLRRAGIPGTKYLDAGSRAAREGSRNYVVFPGGEGLLNILSRQ